MWRSTAPMVTLSNPFSMTQLPSHRRSCGQMRPQISGKVVGGGTDLVRLLQPPFGRQLQPVRDVVGQRAMDRAERNAALAAPAGLRTGGGRVEAAVDLVEIQAALRHGTLLRRLLRQADELQHAVGHGLFSPRRSADIRQSTDNARAKWHGMTAWLSLNRRDPGFRLLLAAGSGRNEAEPALSGGHALQLAAAGAVAVEVFRHDKLDRRRHDAQLRQAEGTGRHHIVARQQQELVPRERLGRQLLR